MPPSPAALFVCKESRSEALKFFEPRSIDFYGGLFSVYVYTSPNCDLYMTSSSLADTWRDMKKNKRMMTWGSPPMFDKHGNSDRPMFWSWKAARCWLQMILSSHDEVPYALQGIPITGYHQEGAVIKL